MTVPSVLIAIGGRWPAFDHRSRVIPRPRSSRLCSSRATTAVAVVATCRPCIAASRPDSTSAGAAPLCQAIPRSRLRTWPMAAAAAVS